MSEFFSQVAEWRKLLVEAFTRLEKENSGAHYGDTHTSVMRALRNYLPLSEWRPMSEAPKDRYILARGDSGYRGTPHRYHVIKWRQYNTFTRDAESFEMRTTGVDGRWDTHAGDRVTDDGAPMTEWRELD